MIKVEDNNYNINLIYYYFKNESNPIDAYKDMANPITMSIATFRKWNKTANIHVLDVSQNEHNWGEWPKKLNFKVYRNKQYKTNNLKRGRDKFCYGMLSKPSVIYEHVKKNIHHHSTVIVVDADLFFVQNPFPLAVDHSRGICCSLENVGYWYFTNGGYDGNMNDAYQILEIWAGLCAGAYIDENFKTSLAHRCEWNPNFVQEETVFWYLQKICPHLLIKDIPYTENFWFDWPIEAFNTHKVKNLHYRVWKKLGKMKRSERGKLCLYVKELRDIIFEVLDKDDIKELYDGWDTDEIFSFHDPIAVNDFLGPW